MELGKKIVKIRKDHKLTQEDLAAKYHVTRQTISSWENGKSYPDLEMLVKISDDFNISLDKLLKEDKKVIANIAKSQKESKKYKRIVIILSIVISIIVIAYGIYALLYFNAKYKLEKNFEEAIKENNFYKNSEGYYSYDYSSVITYSVPNQKMPRITKYSFHFFAQELNCEIILDNDKVLTLKWIDYDYFDADVYDTETNKTTYLGLLGRENIDEVTEIKNKVEIDEELLKDAIAKGNELYKDFYE